MRPEAFTKYGPDVLMFPLATAESAVFSTNQGSSLPYFVKTPGTAVSSKKPIDLRPEFRVLIDQGGSFYKLLLSTPK